MADECSHQATITSVTPSARGCEECLAIGSPWVHLRLCRTCGHVGCCDESPLRHATAHFHGTHHPILLAVIGKMETTIESPLDRKAMAVFARITPRHLDRLFAGQMNSTFLAEYRRIRLAHARKLLQQSPTDLGRVRAAVAAYQALLGATPGTPPTPGRTA